MAPTKQFEVEDNLLIRIFQVNVQGHTKTNVLVCPFLCEKNILQKERKNGEENTTL